nr:immunoglobulin heavy chain junction region [Macaca mulatta]
CARRAPYWGDHYNVWYFDYW